MIAGGFIFLSCATCYLLSLISFHWWMILYHQKWKMVQLVTFLTQYLWSYVMQQKLSIGLFIELDWSVYGSIPIIRIIYCLVNNSWSHQYNYHIHVCKLSTIHWFSFKKLTIPCNTSVYTVDAFLSPISIDNKLDFLQHYRPKGMAEHNKLVQAKPHGTLSKIGSSQFTLFRVIYLW